MRSALAVDHDSNPSHHIYYLMSAEGIVRVALDGTTRGGTSPAGDAILLYNADGTPFRDQLVSMVMDAYKTVYFTSSTGAVFSFSANSCLARLPTPLGGKELPHYRDEKAWRARWEEQTKTQSFYLADHDQAWSGVVIKIERIVTSAGYKLLAKDVGGSSDPYGVFYLEDSITGTCRTPVISSTLQPAWDLSKQPLSFPLTNTALKRLKRGLLPLHIEMWDQDLTSVSTTHHHHRHQPTTNRLTYLLT